MNACLVERIEAVVTEVQILKLFPLGGVKTLVRFEEIRPIRIKLLVDWH